MLGLAPPVDSVDRRAFTELDADRWELIRVASVDQALHRLQEQDLELCLLRASVGAEAITRLCSHRCENGVELSVVVIGETAEQERLSYAAGAADFISLEQVTPALLTRVLIHALKLREREIALNASAICACDRWLERRDLGVGPRSWSRVLVGALARDHGRARRPRGGAPALAVV